MRILLVVFVALLALIPPEEVDSKKKRRNPERDAMLFIDQSPPEWDGALQTALDEINAIMPAKGPLLLAKEGSGRVCSEEKRQKVRVRQIIPVCSADLPGGQMGRAARSFGGGYSSHEWVEFTSDVTTLTFEEMVWVACHEVMHVVADVGDVYTLNQHGRAVYPDPSTDSCIHGLKTRPGSYDAMLLRERFG